MDTVRITNVDPQKISAENKAVLKTAVKNTYTIKGAEPYEGAYEFTPGAEDQTVPVAQKYCEENIVVKAIPNNYGLITYNGSIITVS